MSDPISTTRASLEGVKEAIKVGREIQDTAKEMNAFLDEEARARVAWRRKQQELERRGDMIVIDAVEEYQIIRQMRDQREELYREVRKKFGARGIEEVKELEKRLKADKEQLSKDFNQDRQHTRNEWLGILLASGLVYGILKFIGVI
jgi:uncharacterized protein involved in exopolysaccharide biosynthesis